MKNIWLFILLFPTFAFADKPVRFTEPFPLTSLGWKAPAALNPGEEAVTLRYLFKPVQSNIFASHTVMIKQPGTPPVSDQSFNADGRLSLTRIGSSNGTPMLFLKANIKTIVPEFIQTETYALNVFGGIVHFRSGLFKVKVGPLNFDFDYLEHTRTDELPSAPVAAGASWRNLERTHYMNKKDKGFSLSTISNSYQLARVFETNGRKMALVMVKSKTHDFSKMTSGPPRKNKNPNRYGIQTGWFLFDISSGVITRRIVNRISVRKTDFDSYDISWKTGIVPYDSLLVKSGPDEDPVTIGQDIILSR